MDAAEHGIVGRGPVQEFYDGLRYWYLLSKDAARK
jgi:hypothetical protein